MENRTDTNKKNPEEIAKDLYESSSRGTLKLKVPIRNEGMEITELEYDFTKLTGSEYVDAMDSDPKALNVFVTSNRQALTLFATAAEKCCREKYHLDSTDIVQRINIADARSAAQKAQVFLNLCNRGV